MQDPLIWVRAIHFGTCMMLTGGLIFLLSVAEPAFRSAHATLLAGRVRARVLVLTWISLAAAVASWAAWPVLLAERLSEERLSEVLADGSVWNVLSETDFGHVWLLRLPVAAALALVLIWLRPARLAPIGVQAMALTLAAMLTGSLAWGGHAVASPGIQGEVHLASDVAHLIAAAAWFGALVPLALLLLAARRDGLPESVMAARDAVQRFSPLGIISVGTIAATGLFNSWVLVGSLGALVGTDYGRLLALKLVLFFAMLSLGAMNRLWLAPQCAATEQAGAAAALCQIERNSLIEAAVGTLIVVIVGLLGTLPPGTADPGN